MNTKDYEALLATAAKYEAAPAAKKAASAPAAKKSTTSGSGRGVSGRRRPDPEPVPEPEPDTPIPLGESLGQLPGIQELERGQAGELTYGAKDADGGKLKADIDYALSFSKTAKDAGSPETGYDLVKRQEKSVDELIEKYGVDLPAYVTAKTNPTSLGLLTKGFLDDRKAAHKAQYLGQSMKKEEERDSAIYTGAIARTKALELVTGGDSSRVQELKKLVDEARDGNLDAALENFDFPPKYNTPEAKAELAELVKTIVEAEPKKEVATKNMWTALAQTALDDLNPFFRF